MNVKPSITVWLSGVLAALALAVGLTCASAAPNASDIEKAISDAHTKYAHLQEGKNADYIPALAQVDSNLFGVAVATTDGKVYTKGDSESLFSIQSISKVFTLALVLKESGPKAILDNIGVDATGQVFNSIVAIEQHKGAQENPFVNP